MFRWGLRRLSENPPPIVEREEATPLHERVFVREAGEGASHHEREEGEGASHHEREEGEGASHYEREAGEGAFHHEREAGEPHHERTPRTMRRSRSRPRAWRVGEPRHPPQRPPNPERLPPPGYRRSSPRNFDPDALL